RDMPTREHVAYRRNFEKKNGMSVPSTRDGVCHRLTRWSWQPHRHDEVEAVAERATPVATSATGRKHSSTGYAPRRQANYACCPALGDANNGAAAARHIACSS